VFFLVVPEAIILKRGLITVLSRRRHYRRYRWAIGHATGIIPTYKAQCQYKLLFLFFEHRQYN
jgi:hypothetical protein